MNSGPNVDWRYAKAVARRIGGSGPTIGREGAHQAVEELRAGAAVAVDVVRAATGLHADVPDDGVRVVDRPRWIDANVAAFETVITPITEKLARSGKRDNAIVSVTSRFAGAEVGAALGFMSSRVLGQYELFTPKDAQPQLLLVAPNIVEVEHRLAVNSSDFRLWVCLHEETHRVQFTAVPWLGPWLREQISSTLDDLSLDPGDLGRRMRQVLAAVVGALRGLDVVKALEQFMSDEERAVFDRLTAVMSLLEGHADVVMDTVDEGVIPTVDVLRSRLSERRSNPKATEAVVRRLLGMETKLAQYRDGATFVRAVVDSVGMADFNLVWAAPENLPSRPELHDPDSWIKRVVAAA
jgi:coenzyme F420 biosynthesis associated uncharacterized protein